MKVSAVLDPISPATAPCSSRAAFTIGEILVRAHARRRADEDRPRYRDTAFARLDESRFPHLAPLGSRWPSLVSRDIYAQGLRAFVDGLLTQRTPADS